MGIKIIDPRKQEAATNHLRFQTAQMILPEMAAIEFRNGLMQHQAENAVIPGSTEGFQYNPMRAAIAASNFADALLILHGIMPPPQPKESNGLTED